MKLSVYEAISLFVLFGSVGFFLPQIINFWGTKMELNEMINAFVAAGGVVKQGKCFPPRMGEISFPMVKGSISNAGAKAACLSDKGLFVR